MFFVLTTSLTQFYLTVIVNNLLLSEDNQYNASNKKSTLSLSCWFYFQFSFAATENTTINWTNGRSQRSVTMKKNECHFYCVLIGLVWHNKIYFYKLIVFRMFYFYTRESCWGQSKILSNFMNHLIICYIFIIESTMYDGIYVIFKHIHCMKQLLLYWKYLFPSNLKWILITLLYIMIIMTLCHYLSKLNYRKRNDEQIVWSKSSSIFGYGIDYNESLLSLGIRV